MERETLQNYCKIAKTLVVAKNKVASLDVSSVKYMEIRDLINDCLQTMAQHADVAPIRLINEDVLK